MKSSVLLGSSVEEFCRVLKHCEITGKDGHQFDVESGLGSIVRVLVDAKASGGSVYIVGNGGSASIASHAAIDLLHVAKMRAFTLHDSALITCMANDYGYENAFSKVIGQITKSDDVLIAISSSGNSENIRNAAAQMAERGGVVITFSGFSAENHLRAMGDHNIWLDATDYGMVEIGHQFILHNISDRFARMG